MGGQKQWEVDKNFPLLGPLDCGGSVWRVAQAHHSSRWLAPRPLGAAQIESSKIREFLDPSTIVMSPTDIDGSWRVWPVE